MTYTLDCMQRSQVSLIPEGTGPMLQIFYSERSFTCYPGAGYTWSTNPLTTAYVCLSAGSALQHSWKQALLHAHHPAQLGAYSKLPAVNPPEGEGVRLGIFLGAGQPAWHAKEH